MEQVQSTQDRIKKIKVIIEREIGKEIENKQNEVTEISRKIEKTLRHLDILKYVATVSYYEDNAGVSSKKLSSGSDDNSTDVKDEKIQTQIHPAVKRLLPYHENYCKAFADSGYETRKKKISSSEPEASHTKNFTESDLNYPRYIPPLPKGDENIQKIPIPRGSALRVKHRIIIGNVSKWIPPDTREDNSTHKWMMYLRSRDNEPDVICLIRKVRYFLHDSYKPHDIIDVTSAPFSLTRRGWGEFPVRVQLHFRHPLDKPLDVIHDLKLDMTCSGVQTLGAEKVVEVALHRNTDSDTSQSNQQPRAETDYINGRKKAEQQNVLDSNLVSEAKRNGIKTHLQTDYVEKLVHSKLTKENTNDRSRSCVSVSKKNDILDRRKLDQTISIEHDYARCDEHLKPFKRHRGNKKNGNRVDGSDISGKNVSDPFSSQNMVESNMRTCRHRYLAKLVQKAIDSKIETVERILLWLVPQWPIVTNLARESAYKYLHPYACSSEEEFVSYNIGKQRSAEWYRAKAIHKMLTCIKSATSMSEDVWSTKQIFLWCRHHGYSPVTWQKQPTEPQLKRSKLPDSSSDSEEDDSSGYNRQCNFPEDRFFNGAETRVHRRNRKKVAVEEPPSVYLNLHTTSCFGEEAKMYGSGETRVLATDSVVDIDIVNVTPEPVGRPGTSFSKPREEYLTVTTLPPADSNVARLVSETSRQIGVKLTAEEIEPGVKCDSVVRVMTSAMYSFMEDLLRRSLAQAWARAHDRPPSSIEIEDVLASLVEHPPFDVFTNRGLGEKANS